jgi:carbon storage regulator
MALRVLRFAPAMLVLARKQNQNIIIDGKIIVRVLRVGRDVVKLGIEAPLSVPVHREEVFNALKEAEAKAASADGQS